MIHRIIFITLSVPVFIAFGMAIILAAYIICIESYNPFAPYADTQFAPGYRAEAFDRIKPGMKTQEVTHLLGQPLFADTSLNDGKISFGYSNDGGIRKNGHGRYALIGDFAWYAVFVIFNREGRVVDIYKGWNYD